MSSLKKCSAPKEQLDRLANKTQNFLGVAVQNNSNSTEHLGQHPSAGSVPSFGTLSVTPASPRDKLV